MTAILQRKTPSRTVLGLNAHVTRDFTLIDKHTGTLEEWRTAVEEIHKRGMYLMLDMTGSYNHELGSCLR